MLFQTVPPTDVHTILVWLITIATGFVGIPIVQFIKNRLGWDDNWARLLTGTIAVLFTLAELFITGQLAWADLTMTNFVWVFTTVYAIASTFYGVLIGDRIAKAKG